EVSGPSSTRVLRPKKSIRTGTIEIAPRVVWKRQRLQQQVLLLSFVGKAVAMASAANCLVYFSSNTNKIPVFELKNHSWRAVFVSRPPNDLGKRSVSLSSSTMGITPPATPSATAVENDGSFGDTDTVPTPKVIIDQDSDPDVTLVEVTFGDRLGALLDTMNALKNLGLNVVKANVYLDSSGKHNTFAITKASTGRKVEEPELLEAIRLTIINNLLEYHPVITSSFLYS
ncbi:hypothetical protein QQP08_020365, partial [Theobroma cacao]